MKTSKEIKKEISKINEKLTANKTENEKVTAEYGQILDSLRNAKDFEKYHEQHDNLENKICILDSEKEDSEIKIDILKYNLECAYRAEFLPGFMEIWNSYAGKKCGPKTYENIKNEVFTKTGFRFYGDNHTIEFYYVDGPHYGSSDNLKLYAKYTTPFINSDNVIQAITDETIQPDHGYIENINEHIKLLKNARRKAARANKAYKEAVAAYNHLAVGKIKCFEHLWNVDRFLN